MPKGKSKIITFKQTHQQQLLMLPPALEELIPQKHLVRTVNRCIEELDVAVLLKQYKGGGASIFHPKMMLKVLVYAYLSKIYSSRNIARACREDVNFMWLAGNNKPDFRTVNHFRSGRLKAVIDEVFGSMLKLMIAGKLVRLENYFVDGTVLRADAHQYSYVWKKSAQKHKHTTEQRIKELLKHIEQINEKENQQYGERDLEELGEESTLNIEQIKEHVKGINERLRKKKADRQPVSEQEKQAGRCALEIEKKQLPKLAKYTEQLQQMPDRNSYSKTDRDATFMRMKNGELLPAYNVIIGTENQIILNYTIHRNPGEPQHLIPHLKKLQQQQQQLPQNVTADSVYGSQENYTFLEQNTIGNYLKYLTFHEEIKPTKPKRKFTRADFRYDAEHDQFICPAQKPLRYTSTSSHTSPNGYPLTFRHYEAEDCQGCPLKEQCTRGQYHRSLKVNAIFDYYKAQARDNLLSEKGKQLRRQRSIDVETVFGNLKRNFGFRRFNLRGIQKVNVEFGLLSLAHNFKKLAQA